MLTRNGVELDIEQSKYCYTYKNLTFYFSSRFYVRKFDNELEKFIDNETKKLYNKFKVNTDYSILLAVVLYKRIEKRGFKVMVNNKEPIETHYLTIKV
ncbi:MAG: hypothetical protein IKU37_09095 [Candidatus Gastranaerophilales bacterium]|nr:hypothetical protein [Candidatus Gastranaerophilales bacterium]